MFKARAEHYSGSVHPSCSTLDNLVTSLDRKRLGAFYTPDELAEWVASEILAAATSANAQVRSVVDPACGSGALLGAMRRLAGEPLKLTGIDINPVAAAQSWATLGPTADVLVDDALDPDCRWGEGPPDAVIVNPPWGGELSRSRRFYQHTGYSLASGQFDISDLFVERALTVTRPGALLGFILPDAVFQPDHQALREMLLEHTLLLIARLGEGVFEDVYRSTVVIVLRHGTARANHVVECLQIPALQRKLLGQGVVSFKNVKDLYSHHVPQSRFSDNPKSVFNIAQGEVGYDVFQKFSRLPAFNWAQSVHLGRGVEIGKRGITVCCEVCGKYRAAPAMGVATKCPSCAAPIHKRAPRHAIIADVMKGPEWRPLIVGEDVDRYSAAPRRFIRLGVPGIRYKPMEHFAARKLLIRKTGVGLRAAVDESRAATTQTVFYATLACQEDGWLLDYLQGVINSRPMLAWYLRWSGENQWKSHPYVTPKVLKELPIPDPFTSDHLTKIARRIGEESRLARAGLASSEYAVDDLVSRLYDLDAEGVLWVRDVLEDTEDNLEYFMRMRLGDTNGVSADSNVLTEVEI